MKFTLQFHQILFVLTASLLWWTALTFGQNEQQGGIAESFPSSIHWDFDSESTMPWTARGNVRRDQAGPRPPEFPEMPAHNTAVFVDSGAYLAIPGEGPDSRFNFKNGEAITLEAWVNPSEIRDGEARYVIGKGRTGNPKFARDNQSWALRIAGAEGEARVNFLFATKPSTGDKHWHRWTSSKGFPVATGWHHIAVTYRFGQPESIQGWVNGKPTAGKWDMGGPTQEPPIADGDEVRIGNGFAGGLDEIILHREIVDEKTLAARFQRVGSPRVAELQPAVMPELSGIPAGKVLVQLCEGLPAHERWLYQGETWPEETCRWLGDEFLLPRIPLRYDDWGIRTSWRAPVLVRMAGDVDLPPGEHRLLLWTRALSRLWVDGELIAQTKTIDNKPPNGEERMTPLAEPPLPGLRIRGYRQQEVVGTVTVLPTADGKPRRCRIVLEMVAGGKNLRTETGEVCVAVQTPEGKSFVVLQPAQQQITEMLPLTDAAVEPVLKKIEASLARFDDETRRTAAASRDAFWKKRHERARAWAEEHKAPTVPQVADASVTHPIDAFIVAKIENIRSEAADYDAQQVENFHGQVLPILRENCFRCHGDKDNGGLKVNSRDAILSAGESTLPAVVPGEPEESELLARIKAGDMPPTETGLPKEQIAILEQWIRDGAVWPNPPVDVTATTLAPITEDEPFLRRIYLDTVGLLPTEAEVKEFQSDTNPNKREKLIDRLLADERCADHWMSFWQDQLAENPSLLNASLNSTGPFRFFLHDSLRDQKSLDRMLTELLQMKGQSPNGGSAGFAIAGENDSPFAAKAHIIASAFLGIEMQCARCHDSPYHSTTQRDLYALAAMLNRKSLTVPATSRVPAAFFEKQTRASLIQVTLRPDEVISAEWPFAEVTGVADDSSLDALMEQPQDTRERLAAIITAPGNQRYRQVIVNHVWKRLIGTGFVEPVNDWEGRTPSHPELLDWLATEFLMQGDDLQALMRLILTSQTYQREAVGRNQEAEPAIRFFAAPERRRLSAEQVVDSLHAATGRPFDVEVLTFVHDGRRSLGGNITLGRPTRAWMLADLKNERDRPSLALPRARAIIDVMEAFGWNGSRQKPIHERELDPNVLQPGVLANSALSVSLTRAACRSELAELAIQADSADTLVDSLFLRILTRSPSAEEKSEFASALAIGFEDRLVPEQNVQWPSPPPRLRQVTWFNHLRPDANSIQQEIERRVQAGPPADPRLQPEWRSLYEDVVWSLINHREFVWIP